MRKWMQPETPDCRARVHRNSAWQVQGLVARSAIRAQITAAHARLAAVPCTRVKSIPFGRRKSDIVIEAARADFGIVQLAHYFQKIAAAS